MYLLSPEDILLSKLVWFQSGGGVSEQQWKDILGVFKIQKDHLDVKYLQHWFSQLDVRYLLGKAFQDAGINKS